MTILFFARLFYPHIGGVEKHVLEVSKRLVKKGHRVTVITENYKATSSKSYQSLSSSATIEGIRILRVEAGKEGKLKKFRIWFSLLKYLSVIKEADIVHCHDVFFWYLPFRFFFPFKKVYTTFHGYEGNKIPNKKAIFMHKLSEKLSRGNICVGDFLKKWYGTKPTFVTYGAVDYQKESDNKNYDKNLIVFLGRLEEETGIMEYLKAFKEVGRSHKGLRLVVLGDGVQMGEAKEYSTQNQLNAEFKGFVKNVLIHINRTSFVFTSRYLGILESIMSKKYVLAVYNNEIKKDYLKATPFSEFISISKDHTEILSELEKYLTDTTSKNIKINKGYEWVKDKTWDNMVNLYLKLWNLS